MKPPAIDVLRAMFYRAEREADALSSLLQLVEIQEHELGALRVSHRIQQEAWAEERRRLGGGK
jgi:hypothetical protein